MTYLAHTAHHQLAALWLGCVGWILTAVAVGVIQWRIWVVSDRQVISSGVAWVGLWRVCFNSHTLVTPGFRNMHCRYISLTEAFAPPEIVAGQVLMFLSLLAGLCGNAGGVYALRNVYFGMEKTLPIRLSFYAAGALCLMASVLSLIPLLWNLTSVVTNQTINFPPDFKMPKAPESQHVGAGIGMGMVGAVLMVVSGVLFCRYKLPARSRPSVQPSFTPTLRALPSPSGKDNPAYEPDLRL